MKDVHTLEKLAVGQSAVIERLDVPTEERTRLLALGFIPGGRVCVLMESPWGDPVAYEVCGAVIALRRADAKGIVVSEV